MKPLRIVFLGTNGVGKTSTIRRFLYGTFQEKTEETLAQSYNETVFLPNGIFQQVHILDTCGSDEFPAMRTVNIKTGDYFVVMYAVDDRKSFEQALNFCEEIKEIKGKEFKRILIVGNKIDKKCDREVSTDEVLRTSIKHDLFWFTETSAKLNCNMRCLFQIILRHYVKSDDCFVENRNVSKCRTYTPNRFKHKSRKISMQDLVYSLCNTS